MGGPLGIRAERERSSVRQQILGTVSTAPTLQRIPLAYGSMSQYGHSLIPIVLAVSPVPISIQETRSGPLLLHLHAG